MGSASDSSNGGRRRTLVAKPRRIVVCPREAPRPEYTTMSLRQIAACLEALKNRERLVLKFAVLAGLRPGEILGLQWRHLLVTHANICQRVYRGAIDTPKTQRSVRSAALPSGLLAEIEDWRAASRMNGADHWVSPSGTGKTPLSRDNIWRRAHLASTEGSRFGLGEFPRNAADPCNPDERDSRRSQAGCRPTGHTLDVNQNVYRRVSIMRRKQAVDALEAAVPSGSSAIEEAPLLR